MIECRSCSSVVLEAGSCRYCGDLEPAGRRPLRVGLAVRSVIVFAGVVGLLERWRRPGSRWTL